MKKLRIGILGVSNHFLKRIVLPLSKVENCEIIAIASRDRDKSKRIAIEFSIPNGGLTYDELINHKDVDAVYIPLPNHLHFEWIKKAVEVSKPVLCEKPLTMNAYEAKEIIEFAEKHNTPIMEAFMYRYHPLWERVKDIIRTNQIGKINHINTVFCYNNPSPTNIRNIKEYGGGVLMDIGCYAISVPRFLINDEPKQVISSIERHPEFDTDMNTIALMDFGDATANFFVSTVSEPMQKVDIICSGGTINIPVPFNTYVDTTSSITVSTPQGVREITFPIADAYGLMFEAFADSILKSRAVPTPIQDALNNMKVIDAIIKSAETKQWEEI